MQSISASDPFYPLRQESLEGPIEGLSRSLRSRGLEARAGAMSMLVLRDPEVFDGLKQAYQQAAKRGHVVVVAMFSNACPVDAVASE